MIELIKISKNAENQNVVSARELYDYLEVKANFTDWCKRMFEYGFTELTDYQAINKFVNHLNGIGGTTKTDYVLTLDCAKEIAMIQRTEKGKLARQYFIECEKQLIKPKELTTLEIIRIAEKAELARLEAEQKVENLTIALDSSLEWCSIIKCATHNLVHESVFKWQVLKKKSIELGYGIKKLPSTRYTYQNAYHVNVFRVCYPQYNYNFNNQLMLI